MLLTPYERDFCQLWFTVNKLRFDVQVVVLIGNTLEFTNVYIYILHTAHTVVYCMRSGVVNTNQHDKSGDTLVTSTLIHPVSVLTIALAIRALSEEKLNLCIKIILKFVCLFFTVKYFLQIQTLV